MKKFFTFFILFSCLHFAFATHSNDQIQALKIAHLSSALNLSQTEAEKFWPLYNAYDKKMSDLRHNDIVKYIKTTSIDNMNALTEKEAKSKIDALIDFETTYTTIRKKFLEDAQKILPSKKILLLKKAEDDFHRKLLKKYREKK